jgi:hypothetical protein
VAFAVGVSPWCRSTRRACRCHDAVGSNGFLVVGAEAIFLVKQDGKQLARFSDAAVGGQLRPFDVSARQLGAARCGDCFLEGWLLPGALEHGPNLRQEGVATDASNPRVGGAERALDQASENGAQVCGHGHTQVEALATSALTGALVQVTIGPDHRPRLAAGT